jgi:glutamine synthetase
MASKQYIPSVITYATKLAKSVSAVEAVGVDASVQKELLVKISALLKEAQAALVNLEKVYATTDAIEDVADMAKSYRHVVVPAMAALRSPIDQLEMLVDSSYWPVPSYGDLMYDV